MARFLKRNLPPIVSRKHIVQNSIFTVVLGAIAQLTPVVTVERTVANSNFEVAEGSIVKAVYCEFWITGDDTVASSFTITVEKVPGGAQTQSFAQSQALDAYPNKKNILYTTQGLAVPNTGSPVPILRQWIKIPKGKQRFGLGDVLRINFSAIHDGITVCGIVIYKEYQ